MTTSDLHQKRSRRRSKIIDPNSDEERSLSSEKEEKEIFERRHGRLLRFERPFFLCGCTVERGKPDHEDDDISGVHKERKERRRGRKRRKGRSVLHLKQR